jgi:hypothetical protein
MGVPPILWNGFADADREAFTEEGKTLRVRFVGTGEAFGVLHERTDVLFTDRVVHATERGAIPGKLLDGPALGELIDRHPQVRLRMPVVIGLTDPPRDAERFDVPAAHALAAVFVSTGAHAKAVRTLERHRFCVLTGPPEMGKTAIARMVALARHVEGWEPVECSRPEDLVAAFDPARPQVFVADDAFGSTEFRPDSAEHWARHLPSILRRLHEAPDHWLIWTSRPAPLKAGLARVHREEGLESFPRPGDVLVDASDLLVDEKALILLRHGLEHDLDAAARTGLRIEGLAIVAHEHFTPERIRRLVAAGGGAARHLAEPTEAMRISLEALESRQRCVLVAMLDQPPGPVAERDLFHAVRDHFPGIDHRAPAEEVERLTDHFLRRIGQRLTWVHPSWRDLVIADLAADGERRRAFLHGCGVQGMMLALSVGGGVRGERSLPLLVEDADWDAAGDRIHRLAHELGEDDLDSLRRALQVAFDGTDPPQADEVLALAELVQDGARRRPAPPPMPGPPLRVELPDFRPLGPASRLVDKDFDIDRVLRDLT